MSCLSSVQAALCGALLFACNPTVVVVDAGAGDDAGGPAGQLTIESESSLALTFGERAPLRVRYTVDGQGVAGAPIRFALEGAAHDATVTELSLQTQRDGVAETTIVAGSVASAFRVRVSTDRAASAYVNVSVSNLGFGSLQVRAVYEGRRGEPSRRVVSVYSQTGCQPLGGLPSFPDRSLTIHDPETEVIGWSALPAGLRYAIVARVGGSPGVTLATACRDEVVIVRDQETLVELAFEDAPLNPSGRYHINLSLRSVQAIEAVTEQAGEAATDYIGDAAELYLDALEAELRDRGKIAAADGLADDRSGGGPERELTAGLEDAGEGPGVATTRFLAHLSGRLAVIRLGGPLELALDSTGLSAAWTVEQLEVGAVSGDPDEPSPWELDATMLEFEPALTALRDAAEDLVIASPLELKLPLGTLTAAAMDEAAATASSRGALLVDGAGCEALADWVDASDPIRPSCDRDCAGAACRRALDGVFDAMKAAVTDLDLTRDEISLEGTLSLVDEDGDLVVDGFEGRELTGTWTSETAASSDPLTAGVLGTRAVE